MFTSKDRLISAFEVRGEKRWADPLAVSHGLLRASNGEFDAAERDGRDRPAMSDGMGGFVAQEPEPPSDVLQRQDAREKLHYYTCAAFSLAPFDPATGEGVTRAESAALLDEFLGWLEGNARPVGVGPATSACTATPLDSSSTT